MMFLFSYVTQNKGIEENQGFTNSKNTNEQINITWNYCMYNTSNYRWYLQYLQYLQLERK